MAVVTLPDGRLLHGVYDFDRDWWVVRVEGSRSAGEAHRVHAAVRQALGITERVSPRWVIDAADRLPEIETEAGIRVLCRCCGHLTLAAYGHYEICQVCWWEDDPTTIFLPGERAGPGPNHLSLTEGRDNVARIGISKPRLLGRVAPRSPLPHERP